MKRKIEEVFRLKSVNQTWKTNPKKILVKEYSTLELAKLIPIENLKSFIFVYKVIRNHKPDRTLMKNVNEFLAVLKKQKDLSEQGRKTILKAYLFNLNIYNDPAKLASVITVMLTGTKEGNPRDQALDVLLYMILGHYIHLNKKEPDYGLILDFLYEQGIYQDNNLPKEETFIKRCKRLLDDIKLQSRDIPNNMALYEILGLILTQPTSARKHSLIDLLTD